MYIFSVSIYIQTCINLLQKPSNLCTYYFYEGQTDAELFIKQIAIFNLYMKQFFIFSNFKIKMTDLLFFHCICTGSKGQEGKASRGYVVHMRNGSYFSIVFLFIIVNGTMNWLILTDPKKFTLTPGFQRRESIPLQ